MTATSDLTNEWGDDVINGVCPACLDGIRHTHTPRQTTPTPDPAQRVAAAPPWTLIRDGHPPAHARYVVQRGPLVFTATPCYGMHSPWWVPRVPGRSLVGMAETDPVPMEDGDAWAAAPALLSELAELRAAKDAAVREAQIRAQEARTQRATVEAVGALFGLKDYEDIAGRVAELRAERSEAARLEAVCTEQANNLSVAAASLRSARRAVASLADAAQSLLRNGPAPMYWALGRTVQDTLTAHAAEIDAARQLETEETK